MPSPPFWRKFACPQPTWAWLPTLVFLAILAVSSAAQAETAVHVPHLSPDLSELSAFEDHARTYRIMIIVFQLAAMLIAAKLAGWLCERMSIPGVVGELLAGAMIGPFLLGHLIQIPIEGNWLPLFPAPSSPEQWPINDVIWSLAQFASIILLFVTGLHTELKQFVRYVGPASLIAAVGLIAPFLLGTGTVYIPFFSDLARSQPGQSVLVPALFVGAILGATSIGITARVLSDINKLDTPEGVTIIGAAVVDDVLGIVALAIVGGIAQAGGVSWGHAAWIGAKALGFWIGLTLLILVCSGPIEWLFRRIKYAGAIVALGLSLAFICSGMAEGFGLAFIIGAYSVGLGLSRTDLAHELMDEIRPVANFLVPIFFTAIGMLVDFHAMLSDWRVVVFGLAVTAAAIVGKLVGCGGAALCTGFNARGSWRIGLGMMPRGEVALIVAGIGLSRHIIQESVFSVSILMTLLTTIIAPIMLVRAFAGGAGRRHPVVGVSSLPSESVLPGYEYDVPPDLGDLMLNRLLNLARHAGWVATLDNAAEEIYLLRSSGDAAMVRLVGDKLILNASDRREPEFKHLMEEVITSVRADSERMVARTPRPVAAVKVSPPE